MVLGMAMYAKTYQLTDPSLTDIGSPTSGDGEKGPYTQQKVKFVPDLLYNQRVMKEQIKMYTINLC